MKFRDLFPDQKPLIGMIHTGAGHGSVLDQDRKEFDIYLRHGVYPLVEDNFGSVHECETVLSWLHKERPGAIYGVIILGDKHETFLLGDGVIVGSWFKAGHHDYGSVKEEYVAMVAEEARRWS